MILWRLLRGAWRLLACQHRNMVRLHIDGVWYFACECGHATPILKRPPKKAET